MNVLIKLAYPLFFQQKLIDTIYEHEGFRKMLLLLYFY